jgi:hypothetical protein
VSGSVKAREWDMSPDADFGPFMSNGAEVLGWHRRYEGQDETELLAGFEEFEAAYGLRGRRSLQLRPVLMRGASDVECKIEGWEEGTYVTCTSRAKHPEPFWQIEVVLSTRRPPVSEARQVPEEAVEAALRSLIEDRMTPPAGEELEVIRQDVREALQAAEPHLQRMYWERFSGDFTDAMMGERTVVAALDKFCFDGHGYSVATANRMREAFAAAFTEAFAALDKAQELMEEGDCERCKGSGVELRQGCGEWISDPCPDCQPEQGKGNDDGE